MKGHKKPWVAFVLSLFVPGAGLCYLGKWRWGVMNWILVHAVLLALVALPLGPEVFEYFHYLVLILFAGSAGLAHAAATTSRNEPTALARS